MWLALFAVVCFHAAYTPAKSGPLALLIVGYVICLVQLARLRTTRQSFCTGLAVGFACFAPQLECFWRIFGAFAIALWLVLAFWIALFLALAHLALARFGLKRGALLLPFLWTGLEYFRSELYYLKFSWLNVGYAFAESSLIPLSCVGVYGIGFAIVTLVPLMPAIRRLFTRKLSLFKLLVAVVVFYCVLAALHFPVITFNKSKRPFPNFRIAGVQLEFPDASRIEQSLNKALAAHEVQLTAAEREKANGHFSNLVTLALTIHTNLDMVVLSEYTLEGEPTMQLKNWCRDNREFLIVGGKDSSPGTNYYNTAFVISTNGEVVFKQVKSVPIQFFKDGLPAPEQKLWDSPWGKIGICICYDLCYARVTDKLVRQGAQMLIVPTMDVADWGRHQHELHARVAPVRAAEYGIPIFRVASSGISQGVNKSGRVQSSAPFPGEGEIIFLGAHIGTKGSLPLDRYLAPLCVGVTGLFVLWLAVTAFRRNPAMKPQPAQT